MNKKNQNKNIVLDCGNPRHLRGVRACKVYVTFQEVPATLLSKDVRIHIYFIKTKLRIWRIRIIMCNVGRV